MLHLLQSLVLFIFKLFCGHFLLCLYGTVAIALVLAGRVKEVKVVYILTVYYGIENSFRSLAPHVVQIAGSLLDESQVRSVVEEIKQVITASSTRKRERAERAKAEDFDAEGELLKEENEQEEELFDQVGDCLGTLIKTFKASFLPFFDELSSYLTPMWGKDKTAEERRIAICIFDDVAEQCREAALKYYDTYLPFLLEACNDENPDVRQAAVYGIGVCAEFGGSMFRPLVGEALSRLDVVIRHPNAKHSDNVMAYDNAVSALGKICQFHRDSIDAAQESAVAGKTDDADIKSEIQP